MNTNQLLAGLKHFVQGDVVAADEFSPDFLWINPPHPRAYIINSHDSLLPGEHWLIFLKLPGYQKHVEFFDSYGQSYASYFPTLSFPQDVSLTENSSMLQSTTSFVCGQFCLMYAYLRLKKYQSMTDFVHSNFDYNLLEFNDIYVCNFVKKHFPLILSLYKKGQCCTSCQK